MSGFGNPNLRNYIYPVQTSEQRNQDPQEDPRVQVSEMLKGPVRGEGESYEDYKIRMKVEYKLTRDYLKGYLLPQGDK